MSVLSNDNCSIKTLDNTIDVQCKVNHCYTRNMIHIGAKLIFKVGNTFVFLLKNQRHLDIILHNPEAETLEVGQSYDIEVE